MNDDLTWAKAKNALLVGIASLLATVLGFSALQITADISKTRADVAEIKINLATSQANASAIERRVTVAEGWIFEHDRDDKVRFRALGAKR